MNCSHIIDMRDDDPEPFNNIMQHNPMLRKSIIINSTQHIHSIRQHNPFLINGVKSHCRQPLAAVLSVPPACSYGSNYSCIAAAAAAYAPSPSTGAELTRRIASKPAACTFRHFAFGSCGIVNASLSAFPCGYPEPGLVK